MGMGCSWLRQSYWVVVVKLRGCCMGMGCLLHRPCTHIRMDIGACEWTSERACACVFVLWVEVG